MKILRIAAATAALVSMTAPAMADYLVKCGSGGYRYTYCPVDIPYGVELAEQESTTPCTQNSTWGYDAGGLWTDGGCRGIFRILEGRRGPPPRDYDDSNNGGDTDAILADLIADGTMEQMQDDDDRQGRQPGFGTADAVEACALASEAKEFSRGAESVSFESIDQVVQRARRTFDIQMTLVVEWSNGKARRYNGECRVKNGQAISYSRY
jgi:hypothetical protein